MKNWKSVTCAVGILFFCSIIAYGIGGFGGFDKWVNFNDPSSISFVFFGALALGCAKRPNTIDEFLKYFSNASLTCGVLGSLIGWINLFCSNRDWIRLEAPDINSTLATLSGDLSVMAVSLFYGVLLSAVASAISKD